MRTIVIASQKGGVGKTTLAGHLGVAACQQGQQSVVLIDMDTQGSLTSWWNARNADTPQFASVPTVAGLATLLEQLEQAGIDWVIIDTPPAVTELIRQVMGVADLVVIPTRPSPHDLRAVGATVDLAIQANKRMVFVLNGAASRARITVEAAIALSQYGAVAPTVIHQRTEFASAMTDGRTVLEVNQDGKSSEEINALWEYVSNHSRK